MKNERIVFVLAAFLTGVILFTNQAFSYEISNNSLQWFPSLAVDNGTVYVVWADERNGNYTRIMNNQAHKSGDIYFSRGSFQDDWIFEKNIRINEIKGSTGHGSPSVASEGNNIYVIWEDDRFGFEELYFSTSFKDGIKFSSDMPLSEKGWQVLPSLAVLNETVYVAMMNKKTWDIEFIEGRAVNGFYKFIEPIRVNDDATGNWHYAPSLALDDEKNVCISWLDARSSSYDIYFSHGTKENRRWSFGENIRVNDAENASQYTPSMAFDNDNVYVVWYDDRNKDLDIYLSRGRKENNGWRFDKSIRVNDDSEGDQMHPSIAAKDNRIFVVWEDGREGNSNIYFSNGEVKPGSLGFGSNIKVNYAEGNHFTPQIRFDRDVYIVWQAEKTPYNNPVFKYGEYGTDSGDIFFSQGKYNGKNWEFSRNVKVNDDLTESFTKPDTIFLGVVFGSIVVSIAIASFLRGKNEK